MRQFKGSRRLIGLVLLAIGIGLAIMLKHDYDIGNSTSEDAIIVTPYLLLEGLLVVLNPGLLIMRGQFLKAPMSLKIIHIAVLVVGMGIGVVLRNTLFANWQTHR